MKRVSRRTRVFVDLYRVPSCGPVSCDFRAEYWYNLLYNVCRVCPGAVPRSLRSGQMGVGPDWSFMPPRRVFYVVCSSIYLNKVCWIVLACRVGPVFHYAAT